MNLRDLSYLIALAEHKHFGKAALACFVSQPALSMQIKKLEKFLGVQLIERNHKNIFLTDNGLLLAEKAKKILAEVNELKETAKSIKDPYSGELRIGIIPTLAPYLLPYIIQHLKTRFPNIHFYLLEEQTAYITEKLQAGKLDACMMALPIEQTEFAFYTLFEENFLLAVPESHPFSKRKTIKQTDLEDKQLLLLDDGHCLREQALAICQTTHAQEAKSFRATSLETLRHMIASGTGMTLMPKLACRKENGIVYLPFQKPQPMREIGMVLRKSSARQKLLSEMSQIIRKVMAGKVTG